MKNKNKILVTAPIKILGSQNKLLFLEDWFRLKNLNLKSKKKKNLFSNTKWSIKTRKSDYLYLIKQYENFLTILQLKLNEIHKTDFSKKYWEQIYGIWLIEFLTSIYEKYQTVKKIKNYKRINTYYISRNNIYIPKNSRDAKRFYHSDAWMHFTYIELIKEFKKNIKIKEIKSNQIKLETFKDQEKENLSFKSLIIYLFSKITSFFKSKNEIFIIRSYLPFLKEVLIQIYVNKNFKIILPYDRNYKFKNSLNHNLRNKKIKTSKSDDNFAKFIKKIILKNIPMAFLEEFHEIRIYNSRLPWKKKPGKIFTSSCAFYDDIFKIWLAEQKENGSKFILGQHGGQFMVKFCTYDYYAKKISHRILSWGDKTGGKDKKFYAFANLKNFHKKIDIKKNNFISIFQEMPTKYNVRLWPGLLLCDYEKYINLQNKFLNKLNKEVYDKIKIRFGSNVRSTAKNNNLLEYEKKIWFHFHPDLNYETRNQSISSTLENSYLTLITTVNATLLLEVINFNIPFVILTLDYKDILSNNTFKDFLELERNNILFRDPKKLSYFLNTNDPIQIQRWWFSEKNQNIIKKFQKNYSKGSEKPIRELNKILRLKI